MLRQFAVVLPDLPLDIKIGRVGNTVAVIGNADVGNAFPMLEKITPSEKNRTARMKNMTRLGVDTVHLYHLKVVF